MKRFGFKDFVFKPILLSVATFFIVFFFFPSFSYKYLKVGFSTSSDSNKKVSTMAENVADKTGQSVEDLLGVFDSGEFNDILNSGGE